MAMAGRTIPTYKPLRGRYRPAHRHIINRQNTYIFRQIVRMKQAA